MMLRVHVHKARKTKGDNKKTSNGRVYEISFWATENLTYFLPISPHWQVGNKHLNIIMFENLYTNIINKHKNRFYTHYGFETRTSQTSSDNHNPKLKKY